MTEFGDLHPDGSFTNARTIKQSDLAACPHLILVPEHYRADGSCRCDDPTHAEMKEWGYTWTVIKGGERVRELHGMKGRWV